MLGIAGAIRVDGGPKMVLSVIMDTPLCINSTLGREYGTE
jgi:hypothetical protein